MTHSTGTTYDIIPRVQEGAHIDSYEQYLQLYKKSIEEPDEFWREQSSLISWFQPFHTVCSSPESFEKVKWFVGGKLNVAYNCIDRHLSLHSEKIALLWEGDKPGDVRSITYNTLYQEVNRIANVLKSAEIHKGDTVIIYMPNIPEAVYAMLACVRIGAVHSAIFAGFSADAIASRILDAKSKCVITSTSVHRGGRVIPLKQNLDKALIQCPLVKKVFVWIREGEECALSPGRDECLATAMVQQSAECEAIEMNSDDPMFLLYTSGSTGKPKGILHHTAGYLLHAALSFKLTFDVRETDFFACVADVGWITGHSYVVYGPLAYGATSFLFEGIPTYPTADRYWNLVHSHNLTQLYISPTAIRTLMKYGKEGVVSGRESLRVLGSVGEPLNKEAFEWMREVVGENRCAIVDTYWQTETGAHMITNLPGAMKMKAGSVGLPFFGSVPVLLNPATGDIKKETNEDHVTQGVLAFARPWPGIAASVFGDHERFVNTYLKPYKGYFYTGDEARRDQDGYFWILGRIDDEINVSGHRIGTMELEGSLLQHPACAEAAVVGYPHDIKGQGIVAYCVLKLGSHADSLDVIANELKLHVRKTVGAFATPDIIVLTAALPKTRSGKVLRRILRKIAADESDQLGDVSTLADPSVVQDLIDNFNEWRSS